MNIQGEEQLFVKVKKVSNVSNRHWPESVGFNIAGYTLIAGYRNYIKVWSFCSQLKLLKSQYCQGRDFDLMVYSKKINWFASASISSFSIQCWKETSNLNWVGSKCIQKHKSNINCLLLNKNEDELLSCSNDNNIKAWKINCQSNSLKYFYTLQIKHKGGVYSISLNQSETRLVSCDGDKKIILWRKGQNVQWEFENEIDNDEQGRTIYFISDYHIAYKIVTALRTYVFEIKKEQMIKIQELKQNQDASIIDYISLPTIFIESLDIFMQNHNYYIYFLKNHNHGLQKISDLIEVRKFRSKNAFALRENGYFFVISSVYKFKVYKIQYQ